MSPKPDRIAVPTNGQRPHPVATPLPPLRGEPPTPGGPPPAASSPDFAVAFSPKQVAVGFGILASLLLLLAGGLRQRRPRG
jgi:hypothetical protein